MARKTHGASLDALLDLNGQVLFINEELGLWVKFVVQEVQVTKEKPHGLDYSFTLHDYTGERILGFDNAHPIKVKGKITVTNDHKHVMSNMKPYYYQDAETLLIDFWEAVDKVIKHRE